MKISVLDLICPHYCCSCGEIGDILCEYCKNNIIEDIYSGCIVCGKTTIGDNKCNDCKTAYTKAWCVGERKGSLLNLIDKLKFHRARASAKKCAELLDERLPILPDDIIVVPIPTIAPHIRIRGYGHTELIARKFASMRNITYKNILHREKYEVQHKANKKERIKQAKRAFVVKEKIPVKTILLIDDIFTTGSTMEFAAQKILENGASNVWIAIIARQPLEK